MTSATPLRARRIVRPRFPFSIAALPFVGAVLAFVMLCSGCVAQAPPRRRGTPARIVTKQAGRPAAQRYANIPLGITKLTLIDTRVPDAVGVPGIVGRLQRHRIAAGENLLDVARRGGLGFRELRDANPTVDEWQPKAGVELLMPSRWILPRAQYRGLVINIPEMRLYMFPADAEPGERVPMLTWPVGIGAEVAQSPVGTFTVKSKDTYPTWVVPDSILRTMENPRRVVPPGPDNPLGDYRIRLSLDLYAIHGTNDPWTVGRLTTHGCLRLYPEDIEDLYPIVYPGMPGELLYQPVKVGEERGRVYVEVHRDVYELIPDLEAHALAELSRAGLAAQVDLERLRKAVRGKTGVPVVVSRAASRPAERAQGSDPSLLDEDLDEHTLASDRQ